MRTLSILLSLLLTTTGLMAVAPAASAEAEDVGPAGCVLLYEIHDVERNWVCFDLKTYCQIYLKKETWGGSYETCLLPHGVASEALDVQPFPYCQQLLVGPDIDRGVCVDPAADCMVLIYDTYGTGGGDRCVVGRPVTASSGLACVLLWEPHDFQRTSLCVDPAGDCKAYRQDEGVNPGVYCLHPQGVQSSDACGDACIEGCYAQLRTESVWVMCVVAHKETGLYDYCVSSDCGRALVTCAILVNQPISCSGLPAVFDSTSAGPVCQGSGCPGSTLPTCVESDAGGGFCPGVPQIDCVQIQWLDESVGPVRVTGGGCSVQIYVDGTPVIP